MNWHDWKLLGAVAGGLVVAVLLSTADTWRARAASVVSGVVFAVYGTQPVIGLLDLAFSDWQYAVAGLLAMSGDRLARRFMRLIDTAQLPWGRR